MDNKADKERHAKEKNSHGNENKQNGFMEDRTKIQEVG